MKHKSTDPDHEPRFVVGSVYSCIQNEMKGVVDVSRRKTEVNQAHRPGIIRHGMEMPMGAVYGTLTVQNDKSQKKTEIPWVCIDLNFYPDGKSIDILVYKCGRWIMKPHSHGKIYAMLVKYIEENNLLGTRVQYALRYNGTYQKDRPYGFKKQGNALKRANKIHYERGDGRCVNIGNNGAPYTTNRKWNNPIIYI